MPARQDSSDAATMAMASGRKPALGTLSATGSSFFPLAALGSLALASASAGSTAAGGPSSVKSSVASSKVCGKPVRTQPRYSHGFVANASSTTFTVNDAGKSHGPVDFGFANAASISVNLSLKACPVGVSLARTSSTKSSNTMCGKLYLSANALPTESAPLPGGPITQNRTGSNCLHKRNSELTRAMFATRPSWDHQRKAGGFGGAG
mmetsp:Transcript_118827/g.332767  ORF Transcript_118827/g.332767 Transcript_118827/m.332767 type:complete len:207 (-) Transcript_118827:15-635(-)